MSELQRHRRGGRSLWAWLLDASVYFSFDSSGYERHAVDYKALPERADDLQVVVTGANSGIGFACAEELAKRGAKLVMICRDRVRGEEARAEICERWSPSRAPQLLVTDMTDLSELKRVVSEVEGPVHALIHNAGLLPLAWSAGLSGHELTVGVHLLGPALLTQQLTPQLRAGGAEGREARVIWMSSGGMYTRPLDVSYLKKLSEGGRSSYDGVEAYAYTKRAQVELACHLNVIGHGGGQLTHHSVHPGWVDTPGVRSSLPAFWRWTRGRLRSLAQGADTAVWLALSPQTLPPGFWFDRVARSPYLLGHRPAEGQRAALLSFIEAELNLDPGWVTE